MAHILIVEDDFDIQELLQNYLENEGYQVTIASDGEEALEEFHKESVDLILLDLMLPKLDGYGVCKAIRQESDVAIVMLTALDGEWNQLKGFDLQIDDYITKPFSMPVLLKKVEAVLRRTTGHSDQKHLTYRNLSLDLDGYKAQVGGQAVNLTQREFELLKTLYRRHAGRTGALEQRHISALLN